MEASAARFPPAESYTAMRNSPADRVARRITMPRARRCCYAVFALVAVVARLVPDFRFFLR